MKSTDLRLAGYAAIVSAALSIPLTIYSVISSATSQSLVANIFQLINVFIYVFIVITFIKVLEGRQFKSSSAMLRATIHLNIIGFILSVFTQVASFSAVFAIMVMITLGILMILIGIDLQKCPDDLYGFLKPLSYGWIVSGVCTASIILIPLAILAWVAINIILGMIFFKEADVTKDTPIF